jgi:hypothetical protein
MLYLVAVVMFIAAMVMLQISRKKSASERTGNASRNTTTRYASVKLCCDKHACSSAQSMRDKAFLAKDAPALPLAACDAIHCQCKYTKTSDRRSTGGRRAMDLGIRPLIFDGAENRTEDRRTS